MDRKTYFVGEVIENPDNAEELLLTFPEEMLQQEDWRIDDEITFKVENNQLTLINNSKQLRDRVARK
jgi:antitoxin component of MazEF toxin-antitoxin module